MSVCRLVAGLVGLALAAVVVIVLVAVGSEVRAELAPAVAEEGPAGAMALRVSMAERSSQADRSRCTANLKHTANIPLTVTRSSV